MTSIIQKDFNATAGFVYVLSNPLMPDIIKIGSTERSIKERVSELSATTGVPMPFEIEYFIMTENPKDLEYSLHEEFSVYRVNGNREFFRVPLEEVVKKINSIRAKKLLDEIVFWEDETLLVFVSKLMQLLPTDSFIKNIHDSSNNELLEYLLKLPNQVLIEILHKLFQQRSQVWRELK